MPRRRRPLRALIAALLLAACAAPHGPEEVALEYSRALYASDAEGAYRLVSAADRRVRDLETHRRAAGGPGGFALETARQLASFVEAASARAQVAGDRATVTLRLRLPDANAPEVLRLAADWDERRLNALPPDEQRRIRRALDRLHRKGRLPVIEGEETFQLVRDPEGWRVFVNWAGGVRVRFAATAPEGLRIVLQPEEAVLLPGERLTLTLRATNASGRPVLTRVGHRTEPAEEAPALALLLCPLFVPVTIPPGGTEEFRSEYLLVREPAGKARGLQVTYDFVPAGDAGR